MTTLELVSILTGRAMRAHAKSRAYALPKNQCDFHAGRREAYLQCIALLAETDVAKVRKGVLGTRPDRDEDGNVPNATPVLRDMFNRPEQIW